MKIKEPYKTILIILPVLVILVALYLYITSWCFGCGSPYDGLEEIDSQVQSEINKILTESGSGIVIYPYSRDITMKDGSEGGFAFSIGNIYRGNSIKEYSYKFYATEKNDCGISKEEAQLYFVGQSEGAYNLGPGEMLENAILMKFSIPKKTPSCTIRYDLEVREDGESYKNVSIDLQIR